MDSKPVSSATIFTAFAIVATAALVMAWWELRAPVLATHQLPKAHDVSLRK